MSAEWTCLKTDAPPPDPVVDHRGNPVRNCIRFLHVPRTGGTSLRRAWDLTKREHCGHEFPSDEDPWDWYYGFTRNPWDRVVSLYHLQWKKKPWQGFVPWLLNDMTPWRAAARTIAMPSTAWLWKADWIGRFEDRDAHLSELAALLDRPDPSFIHVNKSDLRRMDFRDYYDLKGGQDAIELVAEQYASDIETFGYKFD